MCSPLSPLLSPPYSLRQTILKLGQPVNNLTTSVYGPNAPSFPLPGKLAMFPVSGLGVCHPSGHPRIIPRFRRSLFMEPLVGALQGQMLLERQACFCPLSGAFRNHTLLRGSQNGNRKNK